MDEWEETVIRTTINHQTILKWEMVQSMVVPVDLAVATGIVTTEVDPLARLRFLEEGVFKSTTGKTLTDMVADIIIDVR